MTGIVMYGGRVVDGSLQSAVQEYRQPTGRSILLVGCVHLAEPDYYTDIRTIADDAEASGATVYFEGVTLGNDDRVPSAEEADAIRALRTALKTQFEDVPELLGLPWIHQDHSAIAPTPDTWLACDVLELDMVRLVGPSHALELAPSAGMYERFRQLKESTGPRSVAYRLARKQWVISYIHSGLEPPVAARIAQHVGRLIDRVKRASTRSRMRHSNAWLNPFVYTCRESVAALHALEAKGDVVMIWHPNHMVGIGRILVRNGFEPREPRQWLTACHRVADQPETSTDQRATPA